MSIEIKRTTEGTSVSIQGTQIELLTEFENIFGDHKKNTERLDVLHNTISQILALLTFMDAVPHEDEPEELGVLKQNFSELLENFSLLENLLEAFAVCSKERKNELVDA